MRSRRIVHTRESVKIYEEYYKPSINPLRFFKSILGVLIFGSSPVAQRYTPVKERN